MAAVVAGAWKSYAFARAGNLALASVPPAPWAKANFYQAPGSTAHQEKEEKREKKGKKGRKKIL